MKRFKGSLEDLASNVNKQVWIVNGEKRAISPG